MAIQQKDIDRIDELYKSIIRLIDLGEMVAALTLVGILAYLVLENEDIRYNISIKNKMIELWQQVADISIANSIQNMYRWANTVVHHGHDSNRSKTDIKENLYLIWNGWQRYLISKTTEVVNEKSKRAGFLCSFYIENYQGIEKIEVNKLPFNAHFITFTGENGYGKTSILQALAIAFYGNEDTQSKHFLYSEKEVKFAFNIDFLIKQLYELFLRLR